MTLALQCVLEFPLACGIGVGTPVRIRGVPVGSVLNVNPSLEKVEVLVDVSRVDFSQPGPVCSAMVLCMHHRKNATPCRSCAPMQHAGLRDQALTMPSTVGGFQLHNMGSACVRRQGTAMHSCCCYSYIRASKGWSACADQEE